MNFLKPQPQSIFKLSLLASAFLLAACSNNNDKDTAKNYYLAPEPIASGVSVGGVDIASGKLSQSESDLSSSTLSFSRQFVSQGASSKSLGGWQHNFGSTLDGDGVPYASWKGLKTRKFTDTKKACKVGWEQIKGEAYNGKLVNAQPIFHEGLCDLYLDSEIVASLPVRYAGGKSPFPLHTLTRPNGTTYTFFKDSNNAWQTTTRTPLKLAKVGNNWQITTLGDSVETYNASGQLVSMTNSAGQTTKLDYKNGKLVKVTGHFGKTLELAYKNGKLDSVKGVDGTSHYAYDRKSRLISVTKVGGTKNSYHYNSNGQLTSIVDVTGNTVANYVYDAMGRVIKTEDAAGSNARTITYSADSVSVGDPNTSATDTNQFLVSHGVMKVASITDTDGGKQSFEYDANGYLSKVTAINGTVTTTTYNKRGLLVSRTENAGTANASTTLTEWHPDYRKPTKQVEPGNVTFSEYNAKGLLTKRIQGTVTPATKKLATKDLAALKALNKTALKKESIREQRFEYTPNGQQKATTAVNGAKTEFAYDEKGNRTATKNVLGQESKVLVFDAVGRPLKTLNSNGIIIESQYNALGRLSSTTSNGQTSTYEYDNVGRQTKVTYSDGSTTQNEYDAAGNPTKTIDQDGNITENSFDKNGNQVANKVMDANGKLLLQSQSVYNNKNQLVKSIDAEGNTTTYEYDATGNQIKVTDANGKVTKNEYDGENRLVKIIDALGGETKYEYDINSNRTKVVAPNGSTTTFEYDNFDQLIKEISPERGTTKYEYDVSGNQIKVIDANGNTKRTTYDLLNKKTGESWDDHPDLTIAYEYNSCHIGSLCKITDKSGSTSFSYNNEGNITQKDITIEGITLTLKYRYDDNDKLKSITYPSGKVISYNYDANKISSISVDGNPLITSISQNAAGQLTGWKWTDGTAYTKTYDSNGRLKTFPLGNKTRTLTYDKLGNITSWRDNDGESKSFTYDLLNRLMAYTKTKNTTVLEKQNFSYDVNGNRLDLTETEESPVEIQTIYNILDISNRLLKVDETQYQYDNNGNIINDGEHIYSYDARNRLTSVDSTNTYLFNANNMRVKKVTSAGTTLYGWDNDRIFSEYDGSGNVIQETVYFGNTPIALLQDGNTYRIYADQIDTPRVLTDNTNTTLWAWNSKPFGETAPNEDMDKDGTKLSYNLRFPGQYYDQETGKHYNFNRDYDPATGRYVQSDPIGLKGGMNEYIYSNQNPITNFDLSGFHPSYVKLARRRIDISIDVHKLSEKNDALALIKAYKGQIVFTVYVFSKDHAWLPDLKKAGAIVGLHLNPVNTSNSSLTAQINQYFSAYRWVQPVSSVHGKELKRAGKIIIVDKLLTDDTAAMGLLRSKQVKTIRSARFKFNEYGNPRLKRTFSTCHRAADIADTRYKNVTHYFFHTIRSDDGCRDKVSGTLKGLGFIPIKPKT